MRSPFSMFHFLLFFFLLVFLLTFIQLQLITLSFQKLGLSPEATMLMLLGSLLGSWINLPLFSMRADPPPVFNRRRMSLPPERLRNMIRYQTGAAIGMARALGGKVRHFKLHGALSNMSAEDAGMAAQVLLELRTTCRRVDGHGDAACHQDAEKAVQIVRAGGQHAVADRRAHAFGVYIGGKKCTNRNECRSHALYSFRCSLS